MEYKRKKFKKNPLKQQYKRVYSIWQNMLNRSRNPKQKSYKKLKIGVCECWKISFGCFLEWSLANGYSEDTSIDRINGDEGYFPYNCRYVNYNIQNRNATKKVGKSGYKGVKINGNSYQARIVVNKKFIQLGNYADPKDAAKAVDSYIEEHNLDHKTNHQLGLL